MIIESDIYNCLDRKKLDEKIIALTDSSSALIKNAVVDLVQAGGKRLRPLLVFLSTAENFNQDKILDIACGVEILHMATLVHDDVIDGAKLRRKNLTVSEKYGLTVAVLVGDFLLNRSFSVLSANLSEDVLLCLHKVEKVICQGEIRQYQNKFNLELSIADYLQQIGRKTAYLFAFCCLAGARESNLPGSIVNNLYKMGFKLGMAYQIRDDILDIKGSTEKRGEDLCNDLKSGVITLPLIYLMKQGSYREKINSLIREDKVVGDTEIKEIYYLVKNSDAVEKSKSLAYRYLEQASSHLEETPSTESREHLFALLDLIEKSLDLI